MVSATGSVTEGEVWKPQVFMDSLLSGSKEMQSLRLPDSLSFGVSGEIPQGIVEWAGGGRIESDKPSTSRQVWSRNLIVGLWWRPYPFTLRFTSEICPRTIGESLQECDSERTVSRGTWTACRSVGWGVLERWILCRNGRGAWWLVCCWRICKEPRSEKEGIIATMVVLAFHTLWSLPQGFDSWPIELCFKCFASVRMNPQVSQKSLRDAS